MTVAHREPRERRGVLQNRTERTSKPLDHEAREGGFERNYGIKARRHTEKRFGKNSIRSINISIIY